MLLPTTGLVSAKHYGMIILGHLPVAMKVKTGHLMIFYGHFDSSNTFEGGSCNGSFIQTGK